MARMQRSIVLLGPALVFLAAALWATDAPFRTHLTQSLSSSFIVLGEHIVSCFIAIPILFYNWGDLKRISSREWLAILFIGVCGSALASIAFTQSFHYVNPSVSIVLQKVQPLIAIALAWLLLGEALHKDFWTWTVVALLGAYLVSFPDLIPHTYAGEAFNPNFAGVSLALCAALLWGASTVFGKYVLRGAAFQTLTALRFVVALVFLTFLNAAQGTLIAPSAMTGTDALFIGIVALMSGVFSLFLYYYGLQFTRASIATIAELGFPLAAVFVNAYFIPGNQATGAYFGLYVGQWLGTLLLLFAMLMLSRVNREEALHEAHA